MSNERIESLEARLLEAESRLAIIDLEAEYARSWDAGDAAAWAALFTHDGVFDMAEVGGQARRVYTGTAELAAFCREIDAFYKGLHFMHLPRLKLAGDRARGRLHFQWIGLFAPSSRYHGRRHAAGYYDVSYRRVDGQWRIEHRLEKAIAGHTTESYDVYTSPDIGAPPG